MSKLQNTRDLRNPANSPGNAIQSYTQLTSPARAEGCSGSGEAEMLNLEEVQRTLQ